MENQAQNLDIQFIKKVQYVGNLEALIVMSYNPQLYFIRTFDPWTFGHGLIRRV